VYVFEKIFKGVLADGNRTAAILPFGVDIETQELDFSGMPYPKGTSRNKVTEWSRLGLVKKFEKRWYVNPYIVL
jgi:hypothetical protein